VFDRRFVDFQELEEKTFNINVTSENSTLSLYKISKVSVAPIIKLESGKEVIGRISDVYDNLNLRVENITEEDEQDVCQKDSDCGVDYFLNGTEYCDAQSNVNKYKKTFFCTLGFCYNQVISVIVEDCPSLCYDGKCIEEKISCTPESVAKDCGVDGFFGLKGCAQNNTVVVQDYKDFECVNQTCQVTITSQIIEYCNGSEICFGGECFIPLECTQNSDCLPGKLCVRGSCIDESTLLSGNVYSIWPFGIGEYFDSPDLPNPSNLSYVNKYLVFPYSMQEGCLKITEHKKPNKTNSYSYVRLNETITNISNGDNFVVLETTYFCSVL
jgi:small nuclear ribonucleoprotein (snRNP)-like protein